MPLPRAHAGARWGRGAERGETGGAVKSLIAVLPGASAAPQAIHVMLPKAVAARLLSALCQGADRSNLLV